MEPGPVSITPQGLLPHGLSVSLKTRRPPRICLQPPRLLSLVNRLCFSVTEWCFLRNCFLRVLSITRTLKKLTTQKCLASSTHRSNSVYHSGPVGGVARRCLQRLPLVARCRWAPWGCCQRFRQRPPPYLKKTSMVSPLGVLSTRPAAATTVLKENIDDGPPRGCCRWVQQRPPPYLNKTSMTGPLGGAAGGSDSGHHHT
jgi:hypothetical protein